MSVRNMFGILFCLMIGSTVFAGVQNLECTIKTAFNQNANPPTSLSVAMDEEDSMKTVINGVQVQDSRPDIAKALGLAQLLKWENRQVSITADLRTLVIKDIAVYSCQ